MSRTPPARAEIEAALARLQAWPGLSRSPQLVKFLKYIVDARLDGNEGAIKAYSIAVDVFGRPATFDPQTDPIVRVQARRLRAAIEEYYAGEGASDPIRFYLPVGRYIPEFRFAGEVEPSEQAESSVPLPSDTRSPAASKRPIMAQIDDIVLLVLLVGVALGIAIVMTQVLAPRPVRLAVPQPPHVAVSEFTSVATGPSGGVGGLAVELVTDLDLFPFIDAVYVPRVERNGTAEGGPPLELSGIARGEAGGIQVTASLRRANTDGSIWSMTQEVPGSDLTGLLDDLSRGFADQLGSISGPLFADAVAWLEDNPDIAGNESEYLCSLLYSLYRQSAERDLGERARDCVNAVIANNPLSASALSIRGALLLEEVLQRAPTSRDPEPIAEADRLLREALRLLPTSSPIWREYGIFLAVTGRRGEAETAFNSALQLNPADLDSVAAYGQLLSVLGPSERGERLARDALARALDPPYWYHQATAINALRSGNDLLALREAKALAAGDAELGSVLAAVAARRLGDNDALNQSIAQLLEAARFRRFGIMPILRLRLPDAELRDTIQTVLTDAGIDPAALEGPY